MVKFENVRFEGQVNVAENSEFVGCEFAVQGADKNAKVFGVEMTEDGFVCRQNIHILI